MCAQSNSMRSTPRVFVPFSMFLRSVSSPTVHYGSQKCWTLILLDEAATMDHQAVPEWESLRNPNAPSELQALHSTPAGVQASSSPHGSWGVTRDMLHFTKAARKNIQTAQIGFVLVQWEDIKGTSAPSYNLQCDGILYWLHRFSPAWGTRKHGGQYWSYAMDSVIMVGLFLDGGSTFADRQYIQTHPSPLSPAQVCYLEALTLD